MKKNKQKFWQYPGFIETFKKENKLDLGQGNTPLEDHSYLLKTYHKNSKLFLKREDLNPNGSFKDRALAYQISHLKQNKSKYCVLSSSGNAAISCCAFCQKNDLKPIILISPTTPPNKISQIIAKNPHLIIKSKKAYRLAKYISRKYSIPLLNPSHDNRAITGFETLGWEINNQLPNCEAIFSYCTSGASIIGLHNFYYKNPIISKPQIIGVQSGQQTFLAKELFHQIFSAQKQLAGDNSLIKPKRAKEIYIKLHQKINPADYSNQKIFIPVIKLIPQGLIHWVNNQKIIEAYQKLQQNHINSSLEGAASLAAALEFIEYYHLQSTVVIISGTEHDTISSPSKINEYLAENIQDIDSILSQKNINK
ncbi:MAG: PLP-dependent lyase/thiolase [Patescibacteria group bacterium]